MDDFDIEMGDVETFPATTYETDDILAVDDKILSADDAQEPGEVDESPNAAIQEAEDNTVVPTKIHLRGLDTMTPNDIKSYFNQHAGGLQYDRVEWIDDTSANLLFGSESAAAEGLVFLSAIEITNPTALPPRELLSAKPYTTKPDVVLQVRFAVESDRKVAGAAARSRFYLLNPEYERQERRGGHRGGNRYRDRDDYDRRYYRRNDGGRHDERYEYDDENAAPFDVNLYDDDQSSLAKRKTGTRRSRSRSRSRPHSSGSGSDGSRRPDNSGKELFPGLSKRRERRGGVRDRSASPVRSDRDGDVSMDVERTRPVATSAARNRDKARQIKELFPNKLASGGKMAQMDQVDKVDSVSKRLSDRIKARPQKPASVTIGSGDTLNIRGISRSQSGDPGAGISIKGRATARELFPEKLGNAGKELFADRIEGRGRPRRKAEDSFY